MNNRFENFVGLVYAMNKEIQRIKSEKMGSLGLRGTDTMVMYYLGQNDAGLSEADLARMVNQDRAAISRTVSKLEKGGYVKRASWEDGAKYRVPVQLTAEGRQIASSMDKIIQDVVEQSSADLSLQEREHMYAWLEQILGRLEEV